MYFYGLNDKLWQNTKDTSQINFLNERFSGRVLFLLKAPSGVARRAQKQTKLIFDLIMPSRSLLGAQASRLHDRCEWLNARAKGYIILLRLRAPIEGTLKRLRAGRPRSQGTSSGVTKLILSGILFPEPAFGTKGFFWGMLFFVQCRVGLLCGRCAERVEQQSVLKNQAGSLCRWLFIWFLCHSKLVI